MVRRKDILEVGKEIGYSGDEQVERVDQETGKEEMVQWQLGKMRKRTLELARRNSTLGIGSEDVVYLEMGKEKGYNLRQVRRKGCTKKWVKRKGISRDG